MKQMRFSIVSVVCLLLVAVGGAHEAKAHKAHQKDASATPEATKNERVPDLLDQAAAEPIDPVAERAGESAHVEPAAATDSNSINQEHTSADIPPEPVSILEWLGRLHPMAIHFPIALFLAAFAAELLYATTGKELFRHALRFTLWGGALTALVAAPLGWMFAATAATEEGWLLEAHRWAGTAAVGLGLAVLWIGERTERENRGRLLLRVSLMAQATLIGSVGFLGGSLLYGFDHLWRGIGCCSP